MKSSRSGTSKPLKRLDVIKLELAVVLGLALGVAVVVWRLDWGHGIELAMLAGCGFVCGGWLALRTRRSLAALPPESDQTD
jgi:F0F1-type ATP synthase assembly protein I